MCEEKNRGARVDSVDTTVMHEMSTPPPPCAFPSRPMPQNLRVIGWLVGCDRLIYWLIDELIDWLTDLLLLTLGDFFCSLTDLTCLV